MAPMWRLVVSGHIYSYVHITFVCAFVCACACLHFVCINIWKTIFAHKVIRSYNQQAGKCCEQNHNLASMYATKPHSAFDKRPDFSMLIKHACRQREKCHCIYMCFISPIKTAVQEVRAFVSLAITVNCAVNRLP